MPRVNIQGVGTVNFPDTMSQTDIVDAIEYDILKTREREAMGPPMPEQVTPSRPVVRAEPLAAVAASIEPEPAGPGLGTRFLASTANNTLSALGGLAYASQFNPTNLVEEGVSRLRGVPGPMARMQDLQRGIGGLQSEAKEFYDVPAATTLPQKVAEGLGSLPAVLAAGPAAPFVAGAMMGESQRQEAEAAGASPFTQGAAFAGGAATGLASEALLGLPALLRSAKAVGASPSRLKAIAEQTVRSSFRGSSQEGIEQFSSNLIAKTLYDPNRDLTEGVKDAIIVGGIIEGGLGGVVQAGTPAQFTPEDDAYIQRMTGEFGRPLSEIAQNLNKPLEQVRSRAGALFEQQALNRERSDQPDLSKFGGAGQADPSDDVEVDMETGVAVTPEGPVRVTAEGDIPLTPVEIAAHKSLGKDFSPTAPSEPSTTPATPPEASLPVEEVDSQVSVEEPSGLPEPPPEGTSPETARSQSESASTSPEATPAPLGLASIEPDTFERLSGETLEEGNVPYRDPLTDQVFQAPATATEEELNGILEAAREEEMGALRKVREQELFEGGQRKRFQEASAEFMANQPEAPRPTLASTLDESVLWNNPARIREFIAREIPKLRRTNPGSATRTQQQAEARIAELEAPVRAAATPEPAAQPTVDYPTLSGEVRRNPTPPAPVAPTAEETQRIRDAYQQQVEQTGFPDANIADVMEAAGFRADDPRAKGIVQSLFQSGEINSLPQGDWSVSKPRVQAWGVPTSQGETALKMRMQPREGASAPPEASAPQEAPPPPPQGATAIPPPLPQDGPVGFRHAYIDQRMKEMGREPFTPKERRTWGQLLDEANAILAKDPDAARDLVDNLFEEPRPIAGDRDTALILHEFLRREQALNRTAEMVNDTKLSPDEVQDAIKRHNTATASYMAALDVARRIGSERGRALNSQKMFVNRDFTLAPLTAAVRTAKGGEDLSPEDTARIKEVLEEDERLQKEIDRLNAQKQQEQDEAIVDKMEQEETPKTERENKLIKFLDEKAVEARKRIRARGIKLYTGADVGALANLKDEIIVGASYLAKGVKSLSAFTARLVQDFGENIRKLAPQIYEASKAELANAKKQVGKPTPEQLIQEADANETPDKELIGQLVRAHLRAGVKGYKPVMEAVVGSLKAKFPKVDLSQVQRTFSDYGVTRYPSKNELETEARRLKALALLNSKLEDVLKRRAPMKTGYQRDKTDAEIRELNKRIEAEMKALGITATDPAKQLTTRLQAVKNRMQNEIEEIQRAIDTNTKRTPKGAGVELDAEGKALKDRLEKKREEYNSIFDTKKDQAEQALAAATQAAKDSIARLDQMLKTGNVAPNKATPKFTPTNELEALRAERDAMWAAVLELRRAATPKRPAEEVAEERTIQALEKSIAAIDQRLMNNDLDPKPKIQNRPEIQRISDLRDIRDAMLKNLREARSEARPKSTENEKEAKRIERAIKSIEKSMATLEDKIAKGDFSSRQPVQNRPETQKLAEARALRDAIRDAYNQLKKGPVRDPEEVRQETRRKAIERRTKELKERIANDDYAPRPKRDSATNKEITQALFEQEQIKRKFYEGVNQYNLDRQNPVQKAIDFGVQSAGLMRAIVTSFDAGAVRRQGGLAVVGNPMKGAAAVKAAYEAMKSEAGRFRVMEEIRNRPNSVNGLYKKAGLSIVNENETSLSRVEEDYQSRWAKKVFGVAASERVHTTFLNRLRADLFDSMLASLVGDKPTEYEMKTLATYVNVVTGRGHMGKYQSAVPFLNLPFFSFSYYVSRLQWATATPLWMAYKSPRVAKQIAFQYARTLTGQALYYGAMAMLIAGLKDDDDELYIGLNPRSSDFGKIVFGETRIDVMSGLSQFTVFGIRLLTSESQSKTDRLMLSGGLPRFQKGSEYAALTGPNIPFGGKDIGDVMKKFVRSKLNPIAGTVWDRFFVKETFDDRQVTVLNQIEGTLPLQAAGTYEILRDHGFARGPALTIISILGDGVNTYNDEPGVLHKITGQPVAPKIKDLPKDASRRKSKSEFSAQKMGL